MNISFRPILDFFSRSYFETTQNEINFGLADRHEFISGSLEGMTSRIETMTQRIFILFDLLEQRDKVITQPTYKSHLNLCFLLQTQF